MDLRALQFLLILTNKQKEEVTDRQQELRNICIKHKINNKYIIPDRYNPKEFDYTNIP